MFAGLSVSGLMVQISPMPGRRTRCRTAEIDHAEIKHWEYALTCPLPPWTIYENLQIRRADVPSVEYLANRQGKVKAG